MTKAGRYAVYRESRFRVPSVPEREMGLWVDRIGAGSGSPPQAGRLRVLGQYAAVAVEAGQGTFVSSATGPRVVRTGDVMLLFPREPTRYGGDGAWFTRWIVWNGPEADRIAGMSGLSAAAPVVAGAAAAVAEAYHALDPLMEAEDFAAVLARKRIMLGLLADVMSLRVGVGCQSAQRDRMGDIIREIGQNLAAPLAVTELAVRCNLSASQFRRQFRRRTGRGPVEFVTARRLSYAKALLAQGASIKEAAAQSGFSDVFYFMRQFKRATGQTAGQFTAANR